jgi:hypothetical protein
LPRIRENRDVTTTGLLRAFDEVRRGLSAARIPVHVPWSLAQRVESRMVVTSRAVTDAALAYEHLVSTALCYPDGSTCCASLDVEVHREIFLATGHRSALVCRPPYAMTLAFAHDLLALPCGNLPVLPDGPGWPRAAAGIVTRRDTTRPWAAVLVRARALVVAAFDPAGCLAAAVGIERDAQRFLARGAPAP